MTHATAVLLMSYLRRVLPRTLYADLATPRIAFSSAFRLILKMNDELREFPPELSEANQNEQVRALENQLRERTEELDLIKV